MDTQVDIFKNVDKLKEYLLISNVVDFFERNEIHFTKNIINNYLKKNLLPDLYNKKYYTRKHLYFLYFISIYRNMYSLEKTGEIVFLIDEKIGVENYYEMYMNRKSEFSTLNNEYMEVLGNLSRISKDEDINRAFQVLSFSDLVKEYI